MRVNTCKDTQKPMLIVCGWLIPQDDDLKVNIADEMWLVDMTINDVRKYVNINNLNFSPEDFLENVNNVQSASLWEKKE